MSFRKPRGYGRWINYQKVARINNLPSNEKKEYIKNLFLEDPEKYYEWKEWCIARNRLPDFFGTKEDPIPIDESKL